MDDNDKQNPQHGSTGNPFTKPSDGGDGTAGAGVNSFDGRTVEERIREMKEAAEHASKLRMQEQQEQDERALQHRLRIMEADFEFSLKKRKREAELDEETQERKEKAAEEKAAKKKLAKDQASKEFRDAEDARLQEIEDAEYVEKAKKFQKNMNRILNGTTWPMHECRPLQEGFLPAYLDYHKLEFSSDERILYNHICPTAMNIMIQAYDGRVEDEPPALAFALKTGPPVGATGSDRVKFYVAGYLALLRTFNDPFMIGK